MNIKQAYIITTAVNKKGYPPGDTPEIAFIGRSNAGKSSLINALCNRKSLARTSQTPGKTRVINFYGITEAGRDDDTVIFVDLPGYGYAKAPKTEMQSWGKMIEEYLKNREQLRAVILLLDIRRTPSEDDKQMYEWLEYYNKKTIIAATKADKLNKREQTAQISVIRQVLKLNKDTPVIPFSAPKKTGVPELWGAILSHI